VSARELAVVDIVGPLCTPVDCLARNICVPAPEVGDLIVFEHSGAYGLTMSPVLFLGHDIPSEVVIAERQYRTTTYSLSKRREQSADEIHAREEAPRA
jgi:hypothetical protein